MTGAQPFDPSGLLVLARCAGFTFRAPGFAHPSVLPPVRAALAFFLGIAIAPGVTARVHPPLGAALVLAFVTEFLLGTALGIAASLVYDAAYAGGRAVDDYVGMKAIAPSIALVAPSGFGRVWSLAFTGAFFLLGGYRLTVWALAQSFVLVPTGTPVAAHAWAAYAAGIAETMAVVAATVAAPAVALSLVVQLALGALSRAIPRFGSITLAFPLAFAAALIATIVAVPLVAARALAPIIAIPGAGP